MFTHTYAKRHARRYKNSKEGSGQASWRRWHLDWVLKDGEDLGGRISRQAKA